MILKPIELRLRNYRAFADAVLRLDDLTFLVGRNGAGKSTIMDAFAFVGEAMNDSLHTALERRGNLNGVRRRGAPQWGPKGDVELAISFETTIGEKILYGFSIASDADLRSYYVKTEVFVSPPVLDSGARRGHWSNHGDGFLRESSPASFVGAEDSLYLPLFRGESTIQGLVADALRRISFHQFSPAAIRNTPPIGGRARLTKDGGNAGDVLAGMNNEDLGWISDRLSVVVPGVVGVTASANAGRRSIEFLQLGAEGGSEYYSAFEMSEGTLRGLGVLLALRQSPRPSMVLLDEIEDSIHPRAQAVLMEAVAEAAQEFPVVVSTHNPDILDFEEAKPERLRVIEWSDGVASVHPLRDSLIQGLRAPHTVGRLLRANALWTEDAPSVSTPGNTFFKP